MSVNTLAVDKNIKEYKCRKPQYSSYYQCIEDNYEIFERVCIIVKSDTEYCFSGH